jgi:Protein of unknown function (DUF2393)
LFFFGEMPGFKSRIPIFLGTNAGTIPLMAVQDPNKHPKEDSGFLSVHQTTEEKSWMPWIVAGGVVILVLALLMILGRRSGPAPGVGTTGMAAPAPYAASLPISGLEMSEATSFSGSKVTYIDGKIANTGNLTITGITVQVGFHNDLGQLALREAMSLNFIRTRVPYVDTEPVSAAPLKPGNTQSFRLIFDNVPPDWNQQFPEIRVIAIQSH